MTGGGLKVVDWLRVMTGGGMRFNVWLRVIRLPRHRLTFNSVSHVLDDAASTGTLCGGCRGAREHQYTMWWMAWRRVTESFTRPCLLHALAVFALKRFARLHVFLPRRQKVGFGDRHRGGVHAGARGRPGGLEIAEDGPREQGPGATANTPMFRCPPAPTLGVKVQVDRL